MLAASQRLFHERQAQLMIMKNEKLEKLCRALQLERNELRSQMKEVREGGRGGGGEGGREECHAAKPVTTVLILTENN